MTDLPIPVRKKTNQNWKKLTAVSFILIAASITLFIKCPSNPQYFTIYTLFGIGIALIFVKSAEKSGIKVGTHKTNYKIAGSVAFIFILYYSNPIRAFKSNECNTRSLTVFVHGKNGRQDIVLKQGYVILDIGGERKKEPINEKGQATFYNLRTGDSVQLNISFSEPYKSIHPDSVYSVDDQNSIYLQISLKGIDHVIGTVESYAGTPLDSVVVKLEGRSKFLLDTSNALGDFYFQIPEEQQSNNYQLKFLKSGYTPISATAYPQTGQHLNVIMEKINLRHKRLIK